MRVLTCGDSKRPYSRPLAAGSEGRMDKGGDATGLDATVNRRVHAALSAFARRSRLQPALRESLKVESRSQTVVRFASHHQLSLESVDSQAGGDANLGSSLHVSI